MAAFLLFFALSSPLLEDGERDSKNEDDDSSFLCPTFRFFFQDIESFQKVAYRHIKENQHYYRSIYIAFLS